MLRDELSVLAAFAVVADERSFTKAAVRLGVSTSAISHSIRGLEERLGVRLLARTTRTVAPTDAGQRLLAQLGPALQSIDGALTEVGRLRARPAGVVRLIAPPIAVGHGGEPEAREVRARLPGRGPRHHHGGRQPRATWSPAASTPASTSASSSSATWWP